ncbi:MAG: DUF1684 domain-containing protein [Chloroflexi bacterium]|nr:MAG: DUF1684 domain-containing protein [Chloroflexota bacterium]
MQEGVMLDLLDYRRRVFEMYRLLRRAFDDDAVQAAALRFRRAKDELYRTHPQSPFDEQQRTAFRALSYYDYDPAYRVTAQLEPAERQVFHVRLDDDGDFYYERIGYVSFTLPLGRGRLAVYWIKGYGGGLFLPFVDATANNTTYGGGRYLLDTIKGADLGTTPDGEMVLDFNFAYHPSCTYNHRWVCPLAPQENRLNFPIDAGERLPWHQL